MKTPPKRAVKGTIDMAVLVRMPESLHRQVERAARQEGLSVAEWLRRAATERLER